MSRINKTIIRTAMALILITLLAPSAIAKSKSGPQFATSGRISGTDLTYSGLAVNSNGVIVVTITNPTGRGISFNASFSFYDAKGKYLDGIVFSGFAHKNTSASYVDNIEYASIKSARGVKVLGRAGRKVGDDEDSGSN